MIWRVAAFVLQAPEKAPSVEGTRAGAFSARAGGSPAGVCSGSEAFPQRAGAPRDRTVSGSPLEAAGTGRCSG